MIKNAIYRKDKVLSFSIFLFFFIQILNGSIKSTFEFSSIQNSLISNFFGVIYIVHFIIRVFPIVYKRSKNFLILSYGTFIPLYLFSLISVLSRGEQIEWLMSSYILWTFAFWIPLGVTAYSILNYKTLYDVLIKYSYILSVILFIVFLKTVIFMSKEQKMIYSMGFSYLSLIPAILHLSYYLVSKRKIILLIFLGEMIMILLIGSRGAIITLFSFIIIKFFISNKSLFSKFTRAILITLVFLVLFFNLKNINNFVKEKYGIQSRTLAKFSDSDTEQITNRSISWLTGLKLIEEKPILGYGIGGDYYPMVKSTSFLEVPLGSPHNGFIQLAMQLGVPFGLFFGLWLFLSIFKIRKNHSFQHRELLIITFAIFVIPSLTVGDEIFIKPGIAMYIYMNLKYSSKNKIINSI